MKQLKAVHAPLILLHLLQTTHLVVNNVEKAQDSYKSRMAQKWGIPVVGLEFVDKCLESDKLLEADPFVVAGKTAAQQFSTGKIVGECTGGRPRCWCLIRDCRISFHAGQGK